MKPSDIDKIQEAGLITAEQRDRIIAHFQLKEEDSRFLVIVSFIGAILVAAGIALLIAAHWEDIPRGVKLAGGLALMLGAHGGGWGLREKSHYPKSGEALHLAGSLLFLANIALVGQIYHLSSRPGNAFLLWWAGIAALPWLLRSAAQFALLLTAVGIWLGVEINDRNSLFCCDDERQVLVYALLGLAYAGWGFWLRRGGETAFATVAERFGLLVFSVFSYPIMWAGFGNWRHWDGAYAGWLPALLALPAVAGAVSGGRHLPRPWRMAWGATLAGLAVALVGVFLWPTAEYWHWFGRMTPLNTLAAVVLFAYAFLQVRVGVLLRSRFMINLSVVFMALYIIAIYIGLIGSMAFTGMMFVVSGVLLLVFGIFLERQRRSLMKEMKTQPEVHS